MKCDDLSKFGWNIFEDAMLRIVFVTLMLLFTAPAYAVDGTERA